MTSSERPARRLRAVPDPTDTADLLNTIWRNDDLIEVMAAFRQVVKRQETEQTIADAVAGMRSRQATWQTIAVTLNMPVKTAQERYGRTD